MSQESNPNKDNHNTFQDVIPPKRKSIRDIPIPENRRTNKHEVPYERPTPPPVRQIRRKEVEVPVAEEIEEETVDEIIEDEEIEQEEPVYTPKKSTSRYAKVQDGHFSKIDDGRKLPKILMLIVGVVILGAILFAVFSTAGGAHLKITPLQEATSVEATMSAKKNPLETELGYEVITLSKEASEAAVATGETEVSRKASGTVVIYNEYSDANQTLIANTRFQAPNGLIYRILEQVVVPGQQTVDGNLVPGSVEVKVFADEAGEKYNLQSANFTIPGFEGDPRYEKFYARTKESISGGFVGIEKQVAEGDLSQIKSKLQATLKEELVKEIRAQLPPTFILFENGATVTYESLPHKTTEGNNVQVTEKGTIAAIAFDREELAMFIAQTKGSTERATFAGVENLSFELLNTTDINPSSTAEITFRVNGEGQLVWGYDEAKLRQDLLGKNKKDLSLVLANYPNIEKAEVVLKPFWTRTFPDTVDKITISNIIGE